MASLERINAKLQELREEISTGVQQNPGVALYASRCLEQMARDVQGPAVTFAKQRIFVSNALCSIGISVADDEYHVEHRSP